MGLAAKRTAIGILAVIFVTVAAGMWLFTDDPELNPLLAGLTRVGLVLGALWFALPAGGESVAWGRVAPILIGGALLVAVAGRAFRYVLPIAIVVGIAALILRPKPKRTGGGQRSRSSSA
jgi:hypothetical protein